MPSSQKHLIPKDKDFTIIGNHLFRDERLSFKGRGMLATMLSLPDDWDYSYRGLARLTGDGETSVRSGLKELEELGYLVRTPVREKGKVIDCKYDIYEVPVQVYEQISATDFPQVGKPCVENPRVENHRQLNTKELRTKESKTKVIKEEKEIHKEKEPTQKRTREKKSDEFEALWSAYPRKQGKQGAYKAYIKALKDGDTFEEMMDGIRRYVEYIEAEGTPMQYVKMGQTFFNGRCWNDEFVSTKTARRTSQSVFERQPQSSADYYLQMIKDGRFDDDD